MSGLFGGNSQPTPVAPTPTPPVAMPTPMSPENLEAKRAAIARAGANGRSSTILTSASRGGQAAGTIAGGAYSGTKAGG